MGEAYKKNNLKIIFLNLHSAAEDNWNIPFM